MFVILLSYIKPLSEVDRFVGEHREFLERYYTSGHFLLSGRKEPRTGGVILSMAETRAEIESIVLNDPFNVINRSAPWLNLRAECVIGALTAMRLEC